MLEVQVERRVRDCKIDAERVIVGVSQAKLPDSNRTQERCIDLVDVNNEPSCPALHQIHQRTPWETANGVNQSASNAASRINRLAGEIDFLGAFKLVWNDERAAFARAAACQANEWRRRVKIVEP